MILTFSVLTGSRPIQVTETEKDDVNPGIELAVCSEEPLSGEPRFSRRNIGGLLFLQLCRCLISSPTPKFL